MTIEQKWLRWFVICAILTMLVLLNACANQAELTRPYIPIDPSTNQPYRSAGGGVVVLTETIKANNTTIRSYVANTTQVETARLVKEITLERVRASGCPTFDSAQVMAMAKTTQDRYLEMQTECAKGSAFRYMADMGISMGGDIRAAGGEGGDMTRVGEADAEARIAHDEQFYGMINKGISGATTLGVAGVVGLTVNSAMKNAGHNTSLEKSPTTVYANGASGGASGGAGGAGEGAGSGGTGGLSEGPRSIQVQIGSGNRGGVTGSGSPIVSDAKQQVLNPVNSAPSLDDRDTGGTLSPF